MCQLNTKYRYINTSYQEYLRKLGKPSPKIVINLIRIFTVKKSHFRLVVLRLHTDGHPVILIFFYLFQSPPSPLRHGFDFSHFTGSTTTIKPFVSFGGKQTVSLAPQLSADHFIPTTPAPVAVPAPRPVQHRPGSILENKDNCNTVLSSFFM